MDEANLSEQTFKQTLKIVFVKVIALTNQTELQKLSFQMTWKPLKLFFTNYL